MPKRKLDLKSTIALAQKQLGMSANAAEVFVRRYVRRGGENTFAEEPRGTFDRVAGAIAAVEKGYGADVSKAKREFHNLLTDFLFVPNSPTWTGAGTLLGQLAACFVLPIKDDLGRDSAGIFSTLRVAALIQQTGGGNGFAFSDLRPRGDSVSRSGGKSSGPVGFLEAYDAAFGVIAQGGVRRGANMAVLSVSHPDIKLFIHCKEREGKVANFNISVAATDAFMKAAKTGKKFKLINPRTGKTTGEVKARELFGEMVTSAHHNGEPGILFIDAANRDNPVPHLYELKATNPCLTGDTLIYTEAGLRRAADLAQGNIPLKVVTDGRFGTEILQNASAVFATGEKDVYKLTTREGYELRLTADHKVMTENGWVAAHHLKNGDKVHILNRKGSFGLDGSLKEGQILGWLVGDGTMSAIRAVLSFFGEEKKELAPLFSQSVTELVNQDKAGRFYPVGITEIKERDEARVSSERLLAWAKEQGLGENKFQVPNAVLTGNEAMQRGFLQALFTADGQVNDGGEKGATVRLSSCYLALLKDVQRLLLNFGIASHIYQDRRGAGFRPLPDGKGGLKEYFCQAQHDLAISRVNLIKFAEEVGFLTVAKQGKLLAYLERMSRGPYREQFLATIKEVVADGREMVYDLQQPETRSFVANGLVVHNCGEQYLGDYENCCLGSINLAKHVNEKGQIDWEMLKQTVITSTRFLDNVVDANAYVPEVPQLKEAAMNVRRIGLGIMGLADAMYLLGVSYAEADGVELASQIMEFIRYHSMLTSIDLAKERGPFLAIKGSIYDPAKLKWQPPKPLHPHKRDFGRPKLDWSEVVRGIKKYGIRNGAQTTVAPTGTISTVAGVEGYGCEPTFALSYVRRLYQAAGEDGGNRELTYTSPIFDEELEKAGLSHSERDSIYERVRKTGTVQGIEEVPAKIRKVFVVSADITPRQHIEMQAALQRFVDNSISKTCNFPADATVEDVKDAYLTAWKLGCKGLTVYVTGTRKEVVLETAETKEKREGGEAEVAIKPRPSRTTGSTYRIGTPVGSAFVTINENGDNNPLEMFVNVGKAGSDIAADAEALGRLSSLVLRVDPKMAPRERVEAIIDQLSGIGGSRAVGFGAARVRSLADGLSKVLQEYLGLKVQEEKQEEIQPPLPVGKLEKVGDLCPVCGQATLVNEEGCQKCYSCGHSEC